EQLLVLLVLFLDRLPLLVRDHLTLRVGSVLADHHEGRKEDRLERHDHRQQAVRVLLDAEPDPAAEPDDVDVDEPHRAGECRYLIRDPVLHALRSLLGVLAEHGVWFEREVRHVFQQSRLLHQAAPFVGRSQYVMRIWFFTRWSLMSASRSVNRLVPQWRPRRYHQLVNDANFGGGIVNTQAAKT